MPERSPAEAATPIERIRGARFVLAGAFVALAGAAIFWGVPFLYLAAATIVLVLVAAFVPRRPAAVRLEDEASRAPVWPDSSIKSVVEAYPKAAFVLDRSGVVRYANKRGAELFPTTRPSDPFTLTFRSPEIGEALSEAQAGRAGTIEFHAPGDAATFYSICFAPFSPSGMEQAFILATLDDVSDRLAIARMRSDFVANASHELRTPLAAVIGFIETLLGPARRDPEATEKFLQAMLEQARRMRRLINDLLSLSRAEMRAHSRPTERVNLVAVLHGVRDAMAPLAAEQAVVLSVTAPKEPIEVIGDRDELMQVFQNLVENGIRYGGVGGKVEVSVEMRPGAEPTVAVQVRDYGPGIPPEHLPRLTERFYRVDAGASREKKGTGLGLAIVKHILTRHQGTLEAFSRPGEGARFTVILPTRASGDKSLVDQ